MNEGLSTAAQSGKTVQSKEVHLWSILLDQPEQLSRCAALLCAEESARAERFYFVHDRQRYTIGRGMLRLIVSHYLGLPPGDLCFTYNPYGKPALAAEQNAVGLEFNLTHTGGHALCAVTYGHAVGVDLETIRSLDYLQMAEAVFSAHEQAALQSLPSSQHPIAFFNGWTRKEAYIKAHGRGLSMPLGDFDVTLVPDAPARLLATRPDPLAVQQWSLWGWQESEERMAALVVAGKNWQIVRRDVQELE